MRACDKRRIRVAAVGLLLGAPVARADIIVGTFNAVGSGLVQEYRVQVFLLEMNPSLTAIPTLDGVFAPIPPAATGLVDPRFLILGFGVYNFSSFIDIAGFVFGLNTVAASPFSSDACDAPPAPGQTCGFSRSAFSFTNLVGGGSTMAFSFAGSVTTPSLQVLSYNGAFSAQLSTPYQTFLAPKMAPPYETPLSYSITIQATIPDAVVTPEPATLGLVATGLLCCAGIVRRRRTAAHVGRAGLASSSFTFSVSTAASTRERPPINRASIA